jgi:flavin reductase (DIM6/NTAB) family NADH-FMN oxidoreductase RutF
MKKLLKKILFGSAAISEYVTVTTSAIQEKVILKTGNNIIDASSSQWLLCLDPIILGVWMANENILLELENSKKATIVFSISKSKKVSAKVEATLIETITEQDGKLYLLKAIKSKLHHINPISLKLLFSKHYKKPQWPFDKYAPLVAAYSYPRKVRLVSFREDEYFNIFPMDLLGHIPQSNRFVFGLRHTNTALSKIIKTKKIVVSEIAFDHKEIIYQLGKHHSSGPPSIESLPFDVLQTEQFGFYIPDWAESYKEIQIIKTIDLGSHMLLWGEIVNEKELTTPTKNLFHIHFLESVYLNKNGISYQAV